MVFPAFSCRFADRKLIIFRMRNLQRTLHHALTCVIAVIALTACGEKRDTFTFKDGRDALYACHKEYQELRSMKDCGNDKLASVIGRWSLLRDSVISCLMSDSVIESDAESTTDFLIIADSIRRELSRLAFSKERDLREVVTIKVETARLLSTFNEEEVKTARKFFRSLDEEQTFPTLEQTLLEYNKILTGNPFKKEGELHEFIRKEDRCFRSLLAFLNNVPQGQLQKITDKTAAIFNNLYNNTVADLSNEVNERVMIYLTMRFNRRILQNAEVCRKNIKEEVALTDELAGNYRWMIIQPYMSIDNYGLALLTDKQVRSMGKMADELPELLSYVEGKDFKKTPKEEQKRLRKILADYFLKTFVNGL